MRFVGVICIFESAEFLHKRIIVICNVADQARLIAVACIRPVKKSKSKSDHQKLVVNLCGGSRAYSENISNREINRSAFF